MLQNAKILRQTGRIWSLKFGILPGRWEGRKGFFATNALRNKDFAFGKIIIATEAQRQKKSCREEGKEEKVFLPQTQ